MRDWWEPKDIRFTREQVVFIIENLEILVEGIWPPEPVETGYTEIDGPVDRCRSPQAAYETPCQVAAEVEVRLLKCGDAGITLKHEVEHGLDAYEILSPPAKRALNYCSGWRRRRRSFSKWCNDQDRKRAKIKVKGGK